MKWAKQSVVDFTYIFKENEKGSGKYHSITPEEMVQECEKSIRFLVSTVVNALAIICKSSVAAIPQRTFP